MTLELAVIGGGITGLTTAYRLQLAGHRVTVFEASDAAGGKFSSGAVGGIRVEDGPDAFLPRDDAALSLLTELGIDRTRSPAVFGAYIWHKDALRRLPPGSPFGIPRSPTEARENGLLSALGAFRAGLETLNRAPLTGPDVSIGGFVRSRFGNEVANHLVDPLLAGVRGGTADEISLAAAAKEIDAIARGNRSVLVALRASPAVPPRFVAPEDGMEQLTEKLTERVEGARVRTPVSSIAPRERSVVLATPTGEETFDGVVVATPPFAAAKLLSKTAPDVARDLAGIAYASLVVVTLVYPPGTYDVPSDGSGFLVPTDSGLTISACTWYSTKWPHVTNDGRQVARCVIGRSGDDPALARDDDTLVRLVHADLQTTLKASAPPLSHRVTRWERAIPQYRVGHLDLISSIEQRLDGIGPVVLAGAGYLGSGIPDCISQANRAAERLPGLLTGHER
jgi:oxygen-dependent protoporphyrinogen oxidase